jgi:hypothetical protein
MLNSFVKNLGKVGCFSLILVACGSESSEMSAVPEYLQDVNFIPYRLTQMNANLSVQSSNKNKRDLSFQFQGPDLADEAIARVTEGSGYILEINEKPSSLEVGASSRLEARGGRSVKVGGCEVKVTVTADGIAEFNRLDLNYRLQSDIRGNDCPSETWETQTDFIREQIDALGLHQLQKMVDAGLLFADDSTRFDLRVKISGIARIPE